MTRAYSYSAHCLRIRSELELPQFLPAEASSAVDIDVEIRHANVEPWPENWDERGNGFWARDREICHSAKGIGAFLIREGREILVDGVPGVQEETLRVSVAGPVFALLLHQRGRFVIHASAVEANDQAVGFTGPRRAGKSTTAAALASLGYLPLGDDQLSLDLDPSPPLAYPSFPQFKLWPDAAEALLEDSATLPRARPDLPKLAHRTPEHFAPGPRPLARLYHLEVGPGPDPAIENIPPQAALEIVLRNWFGCRFGKRLLDDIPKHFAACTRLVQTTTIKRLRRPQGLADFAKLAQLVEQDLVHARE